MANKYLLKPVLKTAKQAFYLEDENGNTVYEGKMTKFSLLGASPFEFVNHVTGKMEEHKVGKTVTVEQGNGGLLSMLSGAGSEVLLLERCFDNHVTKADDKNHLFVNEWEYVINGSLDDEVNYRAIRTRLFIARNALNLISIYRDPEKIELIVTLAESITPGPLGAATQALLAEAWAALETEEDLEDLYHDRRVPVLKAPGQWKTDIWALLDSEKVKDEFDEEAEERLEEISGGPDALAEKISTVTQFSDGLNYDEYLMIMICSQNYNLRLLRIMDLIQINMKYRYYADFNMMEYYTGVRFSIEANSKSHEFEDAYK